MIGSLGLDDEQHLIAGAHAGTPDEQIARTRSGITGRLATYTAHSGTHDASVSVLTLLRKREIIALTRN
jgi:hypothetical protein